MIQSWKKITEVVFFYFRQLFDWVRHGTWCVFLTRFCFRNEIGESPWLQHNRSCDFVGFFGHPLPNFWVRRWPSPKSWPQPYCENKRLPGCRTRGISWECHGPDRSHCQLPIKTAQRPGAYESAPRYHDFNLRSQDKTKQKNDFNNKKWVIFKVKSSNDSPDGKKLQCFSFANHFTS